MSNSFLTAETTLINPFAVNIDFAEDVMQEPDIRNVRNASMMRGYYKNSASL